MLRQRQEAGLFLGERLGHAALRRIVGDAPLMRGRRNPGGELRVEIGDARETPRGEEGVTEVLDGPLDFSFFVAAVRRARLRREVIVAGELEEPGVVADVVADALEDDAFQIVVVLCPRPICGRGAGR
jgi:hypothetical protein